MGQKLLLPKGIFGSPQTHTQDGGGWPMACHQPLLCSPFFYPWACSCTLQRKEGLPRVAVLREKCTFKSLQLGLPGDLGICSTPRSHRWWARSLLPPQGSCMTPALLPAALPDFFPVQEKYRSCSTTELKYLFSKIYLQRIPEQ